MNAQKTRDYFSAYYEGALEPGLKQSFERALQSDAQLSAEYAAFAEAIQGLEAMREIEIDLPMDLHEKISARLDRHIYETKQQAPARGWLWWRNAAIGGLVTTGLAMTAIGIFMRGDGGQAAALPTSSQASFKIDYDGMEPVVSDQGSGSRTVTVRSAETNQVLREFTLKGDQLKSKLSNPNPTAFIFRVERSDGRKALVAVPGHDRLTTLAGKGSAFELAKALADHYRLPVEIDESIDANTLSWQLTEKLGEISAVTIDPNTVVIARTDSAISLKPAR